MLREFAGKLPRQLIRCLCRPALAILSLGYGSLCGLMKTLPCAGHRFVCHRKPKYLLESCFSRTSLQRRFFLVETFCRPNYGSEFGRTPELFPLYLFHRHKLGFLLVLTCLS